MLLFGECSRRAQVWALSVAVLSPGVGGVQTRPVPQARQQSVQPGNAQATSSHHPLAASVQVSGNILKTFSGVLIKENDKKFRYFPGRFANYNFDANISIRPGRVESYFREREMGSRAFPYAWKTD